MKRKRTERVKRREEKSRSGEDFDGPLGSLLDLWVVGLLEDEEGREGVGIDKHLSSLSCCVEKAEEKRIDQSQDQEERKGKKERTKDKPCLRARDQMHPSVRY